MHQNLIKIYFMFLFFGLNRSAMSESIKDLKVRCPFGESLSVRVVHPKPADQEFINAYEALSEDQMNAWMQSTRFKINEPIGTDDISVEMRLAYLGIFYYRLEKYSQAEPYLKNACEKNYALACIYYNVLKQFAVFPDLRPAIKIRIDLCKIGALFDEPNALHQELLKKWKKNSKIQAEAACKKITVDDFLKIGPKKFLYSKISNTQDFPQVPQPLKHYTDQHMEDFLAHWSWEKMDFDQPYLGLYSEPIQIVNDFCACLKKSQDVKKDLEKVQNIESLDEILFSLNPDQKKVLKDALPKVALNFQHETILLDVQNWKNPKFILFPFSCSEEPIKSPRLGAFFLNQQKEDYQVWSKRRMDTYQMEFDASDIQEFREKIKIFKNKAQLIFDENAKKKDYLIELAQKIKNADKIREAERLEFKIEVQKIFETGDKFFKKSVQELEQKLAKYLDKTYGIKDQEIGNLDNPFKLKAEKENSTETSASNQNLETNKTGKNLPNEKEKSSNPGKNQKPEPNKNTGKPFEN